ncbi:MAG: hypothetical protein QME12_06615 [Nanoarchaeota archaeon]|nr:hypothetical protein [Nanoarchaeota archaeon]
MTGVNWSNMSDLSELPQAANTTTGGTFWVGMLYMVWVILMLTLSGYGLEAALLIASFASMIIGILLAYADLVAWGHVLFFVAVMLFMFLYIMYTNSRK